MMQMGMKLGLGRRKKIRLSGIFNALVSRATHWWDVEDLENGIQALPNRGSGVTADGQVDLEHTGDDYVWLPAAASSTTDYVEINSTGVIPTAPTAEVVWHGIVPAAGTNAEIAGANAGAFVVMYFNGSDNSLRIHRTTSTTGPAFKSFGAHGLTPGDEAWVRYRRTASTGDETMETSSDGVTWTQVGVTGNVDPGDQLLESARFRIGFGNLGTSRGDNLITYRAWAGEFDNPVVELFPDRDFNINDWTDATSGEQVSIIRAHTGLQTTIVTESITVTEVAGLGSTSNADTNDPVVLPHDGEDYVWMPGVTGNHVTTSVALSAPGSATLRTVFRAIDRFNTNTGAGVSLALGADTSRFYLFVTNDNRLTVTTTDDGTGSGVNTTFDATGIGLFRWVEVEHDLGTTDIRLRWSADTTLDRDFVSWSSVITGTSPGVIRGDSMTFLTPQFRNGGAGVVEAWFEIGSTLISRMSPNTAANLTGSGWTSAETGETWIVARSATGLKTTVVNRDKIVFDGTDDYGVLPALAIPTFTGTAGKHTVIALANIHSGAGDWGRIYSSESASDNALLIGRVNGTTNMRVGVGGGGLTSITLSGSDYADGDPFIIAAVCDDGDLAAYTNREGLSATSSYTTRTPVHGTPRIGMPGWLINATNGLDGEIMALIDIPGVALTETELDNIAAKLLSGNYDQNDDLARQSGFWYDAKALSSSADQAIPNWGRGPIGAEKAVLGSTDVVDANDPVVLTYSGEEYTWFPGEDGNYRFVTDNSLNSVTGDIDIRADVALDDWTPSVLMGLVNKYQTTGNQRSYRFGININGELFTWFSADGSTASSNVSSQSVAAALGISNGDRAEVRVTIEFGETQGRTMRFWGRLPGVTTWTEIGVPQVVGTGDNSIYDGTADVRFGLDFNTTGVMLGKMYGAEVRDGVDGTVVADFVDSIVVRTPTGYKTTIVNSNKLVFDGVNDYLQLPESATPTFTATAGKHTTLVAFTKHGNSNGFERLLSAESVSLNGIAFLWSAGSRSLQALVGGSTASVGKSVVTPFADDEELIIAAAVVDDGALDFYSYGSGLTGSPGDISGVGTITFLPWRLGSVAYSAAAAGAVEVVSVLDFPNEALTADELDAISKKLYSTYNLNRTWTIPINIDLPVISGTPEEAQVLTVSNGAWNANSPITYSYQWKADNVNISGATAQTYTLQASDIGTLITCDVTALAQNNSQPATIESAAVGPVVAIIDFSSDFNSDFQI